MIRHRDKEYEVKKLSWKDQLAHESYLKDQHMEEVKRQMYGLPLPLAQHAWNEAREEIKAIDLSSDSYSAKCLSLPAIAFALYLFLKSAGEKEITKENGMELLEANPEYVKIVFHEILGF